MHRIELLLQITYGLLAKKIEDERKNYVKMDYNIIEQEQCFQIQVTKCATDGYPDLKLLLTNAMRSYLALQKLDDHVTVAMVEEKSGNSILVKKVVCFRNTSISLVIHDQIVERQTTFAHFKYYVSIKLLVMYYLTFIYYLLKQ